MPPPPEDIIPKGGYLTVRPPGGSEEILKDYLAFTESLGVEEDVTGRFNLGG